MKSSTLPFLAMAVLSSGCPTSQTTAPHAPENVPSLASGPGSDLQIGQPLEHDIQGGERHEYKLNLGAEQFARVAAAQRGTDLAITVHTPTGSHTFDSVGPDDGPELFTITSQDPGEYRIQVESLAKKGRSGTYAITLQRIEPLAKDPNGRSEQYLKQWDRDDCPGLVVAVARDGEIVYQRALGAAQLEHGVSLSQDSVVQAASVAKQFTAFAILLLAERGVLSLDDDVRTHIPELPDFGHRITLRHLIHHQSGIRDQWALMEMSGGRWEDRMNTADVLEMMRHQRDLDFVPGTQFSYSNTGYTLLAEVVARASGTSFPTFTRENIFVPLGMDSTRFVDDVDTVVPGLADSYIPDGDGFKKGALNQANPGPSSLYTTAADMIKWLANLDSPTVGTRATIDAMQARSVLDGAPMDYAAGLFHGTHHGLAFIGHSGSHAGYRSAARRYPEHRLSVVVLGNLSSVSATRIAAHLAEFQLHDHVKDEPAESAQNQAAAAASPENANFDGQSLDAFTGVFKLPGDLLVEFRRDGDNLLVVFQGAELPLERESLTSFVFAPMSARIIFEPDASGKVDRVRVDRSGQVMEGERLPVDPPSAAQMASYAGTYLSLELDALLTVAVDNGTLVVKQRRKDDIALTPADKDGFTGDAWYMGRVVFERDKNGAITGLLVSGTRARNVRFVRQ